MSDILSTILATKASEVAQRTAQFPISLLRKKCETAGVTRGFADTISHQISLGNPAVISELKKASPSRGVIRSDFNPAEIALLLFRVQFDRGVLAATCMNWSSESKN